MYRLCARDRQRYMDYHIERMKHFLFKMPERREEQQLYLNRAEAKMNRDWSDPAVSEPLVILLGGGSDNGGSDNIEEGQRRLRELRRRQVSDYLANLQKTTLARKTLNGRFQDLLNS